MSTIELTVTRENAPPRVSPAASIEAAAIGLSHAAGDGDVRSATITEVRRVPYKVAGEVKHYTHRANLITFTRTGPQQFANGKRPWFDDKPRGQAPGLKARKKQAAKEAA